jgi:large subunit ribosomal protein L15
LGALRKKNAPYKILGNGEISTALNIIADKFSESAKQKIEAAGGTIKSGGIEKTNG